MTFDLAAALRRLKPEKDRPQLTRRTDSALPFITAQPAPGPPLLLDTSVYIDVLQDRAPVELEALLKVRQLNHSSVALGELAHLLGRLDPAHPDSKAVLALIKGTIEDIPRHRLSAPSVQSALDAGIVTGMFARFQGVPRADRQPLFNDACLFFQAMESGWTLLSANISDMDLIGQLVPAGRLLLYRQRP